MSGRDPERDVEQAREATGGRIDRERAMHKGMTMVLANLVLAHVATGSISWSSPDEYLSISLATTLFHFVAACLPWFVWRWYRDRPRIVFHTSIQTLLSVGFVFAFWWP